MNKILALVTFLVVTAACATPPATNTPTNSNANTAVSKSAAPTEAEMIAKEKAVWDTLTRKDYDAFGKTLASDYIEVTQAGVFDKSTSLGAVKDFNVTEATFSDWKMLPIDNDAVILTYNVNLKGTFKGQDIPPGPYRSAAAWVNRDGKWQAIYFQQSMVKPMPAPPPPASSTKSPTPNTSPAPAAKPAAAGPDAIANEKLVWDFFKTRNYDGFASLLAPEFMEIESYAVFDKADAVESAAEFDATKFELSEWKSVKLDSDASLVTYLVNPNEPKFDQERHTSIWANRGGKWVALLHVGTPVMKPGAKPEATKK